MHRCPCCEKEYNKRVDLREHLALHPDYRPFICETCGNGFKSMQELTSHFRKHTGEKKFKCGVCDMLLVSSSSYKGHMLTHTGERPYPCKLCDKEFRQISSLRKHLISIHNQGEKPFLCKLCDKRFASIYHLRIHSNSHTGDRPYRCQFCKTTFSQPSALKAHTGRIHANELRQQKLEKQISNWNCGLSIKESNLINSIYFISWNKIMETNLVDLKSIYYILYINLTDRHESLTGSFYLLVNKTRSLRFRKKPIK